MSDIINLEDWLLNEQPAVGTGTDTMTGMPGGPPTTDPYAGGPMPPAASPQGDPNISNMMPPAENEPQQPEDMSADPQMPDMPEEKEELDFERWKKKFLTISIKGDVEEMKEMILDVRDNDLDAYERKFVEDNLQIIFLREQSNIDKASKEIRKLIKEDLDHNNPATSVVNHMTSVLESMPLLNNVFIKLTGLHGMKSDPHRKFIAALTGSVQVGSGANTEDLIFNERDYSIRISTRMNARFGDVYLGDWSLRVDDPERYLTQPELKRLDDGSPEEKIVLRRRVIMESIAEQFKTRAIIANVVRPDGTVYTLGWDLATSLKAAYTEGKLVVRSLEDDNTEAMIDDDGTIISFPDLKIMYTKETGGIDEEGRPEVKEMEFMHRRTGQLYLTAQLPVIKEASSSFQGIVFKEMPYQGNPSDLLQLSRCIPSLPELVLRNC